MARRRLIGFYRVTDGSHAPDTIPLAEFHARAAAAAAKPKHKGKGRKLPPGDGSALWAIGPQGDRRCQFRWSKGERKGQQCKAWAMRGATRCPRHGGYREVPEHPATVRRLADVEHMVQSRAARLSLADADPHARQQVESVLRGAALPLHATMIIEGIEALEQEDGGRAYRRWVQHAKATAPAKDRRAKKPKLATRKRGE